MASASNPGPYTIHIDDKSGPPPPYDVIALPYKPVNDPEKKECQKPVPPPQQTTNNTSTIISLPEIIENTGDNDALVESMVFNVKSIRSAFIKKVFGIVLMQLLITALVTYGLLQCPPYFKFAVRNPLIVVLGSVVCYFTTFLAMMVFTDARRKVPYNYIFLLLFTLSFTALLPLALKRVPIEQITYVTGVTFIMVLSLTLFAFQTKIDFTVLSSSCLALVLPLILLGIAVLTTNYDKLNFVYTTIGIIIISLYVVWDVQLIIGGEHRYGFSPEEYVFAALVLYVDIMYLFLRLLRYAR